ncbi:hypothetical protein CR513_14038, partial [Mucuna pruriens]
IKYIMLVMSTSMLRGIVERRICSRRACLCWVRWCSMIVLMQLSGSRVRFGQPESKATEGQDQLGTSNAESKLSRQLKPRATNGASPLHSPPIELKPLLGHLKYAYLDDDQQFLVIIANNIYQEQEEKLLQVLRQHKKAIG